MGRHSALAIVPAYNEETNIEQVINDLRACGVDLDVVVVNDGSSDSTSRTARQAGARVLDLACNLGIGGAVQTGLLYARDHGYQAAMQIDGDGQHRPSEIPRILQPILDGQVDVAIGSRFLGSGSFKSSLARRIGIGVFRGVLRLVTGRTFTDSTSGFRAYNEHALSFLAGDYPCDYPEVEAVVVLSRNGFRIMEYPVVMAERRGGRSSITPIRSVYYMVKVLLAILVSVLRAPGSRRPKAE